MGLGARTNHRHHKSWRHSAPWVVHKSWSHPPTPSAALRTLLYHVRSVWSLGVILFELITLKRPFDAASIAILVAKIATSEYNKRALTACPHPEPLKLLATSRALLHPNPSERCTLADCEERLSLLVRDDDAVACADDEVAHDLASPWTTQPLRALPSDSSIQFDGRHQEDGARRCL